MGRHQEAIANHGDKLYQHEEKLIQLKKQLDKQEERAMKTNTKVIIFDAYFHDTSESLENEINNLLVADEAVFIDKEVIHNGKNVWVFIFYKDKETV